MRDSVIHKDRQVVTESIELFTEDPSSSRLYDLASCQPLSPSTVSKSSLLSLPVCRRSNLLPREGERRGWARSRESLNLYKSFNALGVVLSANITRLSHKFGWTFGVIKGCKVLEGLVSTLKYPYINRGWGYVRLRVFYRLFQWCPLCKDNDIPYGTAPILRAWQPCVVIGMKEGTGDKQPTASLHTILVPARRFSHVHRDIIGPHTRLHVSQLSNIDRSIRSIAYFSI